MDELGGKVAVVTGAGSGIGLALVRRFARESMRVVLADVQADALAAADAELRDKGTETLAVHTDVSDPDSVVRLADAAYAAFGAVHVLCNNAGVAATGLFRRAWESPLADWDWTLAVNLMGVVHGVRAFVPRMLAGGDAGHVVNTASSAAWFGAGNPYSVSKHGVFCFSEGLYHDLAALGAPIGVSVLCPGLVNTQIVSAERNRPERYGRSDLTTFDAVTQRQAAAFDASLQRGYDPDEIAVVVLDAIRTGRLYVVPVQEHLGQAIDVRLHAMLERRNPPTRLR